MANALVYRTHDPAKIAEQLELRVREDLGTHMRVPHEIVGHGAPDRAGVLKDVGRMLVGADLNSRVATVRFTLPWHRQATLTILATRYLVNSICPYLLYDVELARDLDGAVGFEKKAFFGEDDRAATIASRLNGIPGLAKRVKDVLRDHQLFGANMLVKQEPIFWIDRDDTGAGRLQICTLARFSGIFIAKANTNAGEVLSIARAIESAL